MGVRQEPSATTLLTGFVVVRLTPNTTLLNLVAEHFHGEVKKPALWFTTLNPLLGNVTPRDMIRFGRYKKLFKFVVTAIAENKR